MYWGIAHRENGSTECIASAVKLHVSAWVDRVVSMPGIESVEMFAEPGDSSTRAAETLRKHIGARLIFSWQPGQSIQRIGSVDMRKPRVRMKDRGTHYLGEIEMPRVDGGCIRASAIGAFPWEAVKKAATAAMRIASDPALVPIIGPQGMALATSARAISKMAEHNMPLLRAVSKNMAPTAKKLAHGFVKRANSAPKPGPRQSSTQATSAYGQGSTPGGGFLTPGAQQPQGGYYPPAAYPQQAYGGYGGPQSDPETSPELPDDEYYGDYDDGSPEPSYQEEWDNGENYFADQAEEAGDDTTDEDWQEEYGGEGG
jgi:hypothetical protein